MTFTHAGMSREVCGERGGGVREWGFRIQCFVDNLWPSRTLPNSASALTTSLWKKVAKFSILRPSFPSSSRSQSACFTSARTQQYPFSALILPGLVPPLSSALSWLEITTSCHLLCRTWLCKSTPVSASLASLVSSSLVSYAGFYKLVSPVACMSHNLAVPSSGCSRSFKTWDRGALQLEISRTW